MTFLILTQDSLLKEKINTSLPKLTENFKIVSANISKKELTKKISILDQTCILLIFDASLQNNSFTSLSSSDITMLSLFLGNCLSKNILTFTNIEQFKENLVFSCEKLIFYNKIEEIIKNIKTNFNQIKNDAIIKDSKTKLYNLGIPFTANCFSNYIQRNKNQVFDLFIKANIDLNAKDDDGTPLLNVAVRYENETLVKKFIKLGVNINTPSEDRGYTPVMDAVWKGNKTITKLLIAQKAELNTINKEGQTNLILAVGADKLEICKLLVENGADPDIKDQMGMSAYNYATLFKKEKIIEILKPYHKEL